MRNRLLTLVAVVGATTVPAGARAQQPQYHADFPAAREAFQRNDLRRASYTLQVASAHVREEVGRCKDGDVGNRLMAAESRLDALAGQVRAGSVSSIGALDAVFAPTDRLLAEHHIRLATWGWSNQRQTANWAIGYDLGAAAKHHVRAVREEGRTLDDAAKQAVADAERLSNQIALSPDALPKETGTAIAALSKVILPAQVVAQGTPQR